MLSPSQSLRAIAFSWSLWGGSLLFFLGALAMVGLIEGPTFWGSLVTGEFSLAIALLGRRAVVTYELALSSPRIWRVVVHAGELGVVLFMAGENPPVELLERLAGLTPRPRINLILYHGALAPRGGPPSCSSGPPSSPIVMRTGVRG